MKTIAGIWIASLPKIMEGRKILDVTFISPNKIDMEKWMPSFPFSFYIAEDQLFQNKISESLIHNFHLAITDIDLKNTHTHELIEIARNVVYPKIRRAVLAIDIASYTGHIYISPEIMIKLSGGAFSTWIGRSSGKPQGDPYGDIINLVEIVFQTCKDNIFLQRFERALIKWGESQEESKQSLRTAKLWSVLDTLLHKTGEEVIKTIIRRCIALAKMKAMESIKLFSIVGWRTFFKPSNHEDELNF